MYDGFFKRLNIKNIKLQNQIIQRVKALCLIHGLSPIASLWRIEIEIQQEWWYDKNLNHIQ